MSYGTQQAVAAKAQTWTRAGSWYDYVPATIGATGPPIVPATDAVQATNPTLAQVNLWLAEVSSLLDIALQSYGFDTPVTNATALPALNMIVESLTADLCNAANSSGRFYTERVIDAGLSPMTIIGRQIQGWIEQNATGLEKMLVVRKTDRGVSTSFSVTPKRQA